jgi:ribonuclease E
MPPKKAAASSDDAGAEGGEAAGDTVAELSPAAPQQQLALGEPAAPVAEAASVQPPLAAEPIVVAAPAPVAEAAPAVPAAPAVVAFALPLASLESLAESAGLQWVHSDTAKVAAVQAAMAAEPKPVHVPRERPPLVTLDEGPLVLVETKKDLSQVKLPFDH